MVKVRPEVKHCIEDTLRILNMLDKENAERVKDLIEQMKTEEEIVKFLITPINMYHESGKEPTRRTLDKVVQSEKIIIQEKAHLPHKMIGPNGKGVISHKERLMIPVIVRANQQVAMKEGKSAKNDTNRNLAGQVTGKDARSGALTDSEIMVLIAHNADNVLKELMGPASHDIEGSKQMKREIMRKGTVSLKELPQESKNKKGNVYLSHVMRAIGVDTDLVESPLK